MTGTVYLLGIGPGAPHHLTVRAVEILSRANAVVAPRGIAEEVLAKISPGVERLEASSPTPTARLLGELADRHAAVARLYLGDPFLLNAGGAEAAILIDAGVPIEVVPGIPGVSAAAGLAGIAGSGAEGEEPIVFFQYPLSDASATVVIDLIRAGGSALGQGAARDLQALGERLRSGGIAPEAEVVLIRRGGFADQAAVFSTLVSSSDIATGEERTMVVVGAGARRSPLSWLEGRPLYGRRIVVTRSLTQSGPLVAALAELGADVISTPLLRIGRPEDPEPLLRAVRQAGRYDWIIFTSANAVRRFWLALREVGLDTRALAGVSIGAIGPATAEAVEFEGARADLVPADFIAGSMVDALASAGLRSGANVLIPQSDLAGNVIADSLRRLGAQVEEVVAYRTLPNEEGASSLRRHLASATIDVIAFTSGSAVRYFAEYVAAKPPREAAVAAIGPSTSEVARGLGWEIAIEAEEHTSDGIVAGIMNYVGKTLP